MQGVENSLGIQLLKRTLAACAPRPQAIFYTTRRLAFWAMGSSLNHSHAGIRGARKEIRVDVSRTIGWPYLPGFFHAKPPSSSPTWLRVTCEPSDEILTALEATTRISASFVRRHGCPKTLRITHRFEDRFTLIAQRIFLLGWMPSQKKAGWNG